jgi:hypothetical protein
MLRQLFSTERLNKYYVEGPWQKLLENNACIKEVHKLTLNSVSVSNL